MRVVIREEAVDDLDRICSWMEKENPATAIELLQRIRERIGRLATPGLAHMGRPGMVSGTRELVEAPYIIVYQVDARADQIEITAVFHTKQDRE
jgi:toxin ParE1/3/4